MINCFKSAIRFTAACVSALVLLVPTGCSAPSLSKAYTLDSLEAVPGIEGKWIQTPKPGDEPDVALSITLAENGLYAVDVTVLKPKERESATPQHLLVGFTRINGELFADATADTEREPVLKFYRDYIIPVHVFARVALKGASLEVSPLSGGGLEKFLKDQPNTIAHAVPDSSPVLTADTAGIRVFLAAHRDEAGLFSQEPARFERAPETR